MNRKPLTPALSHRMGEGESCSVGRRIQPLRKLRVTDLAVPSPVGYVFTVRAKNWHGARDLSRRNAGPADPRWEIAMLFRQPTFLRTEVRAPMAVPGGTVNTYPVERERVRVRAILFEVRLLSRTCFLYKT